MEKEKVIILCGGKGTRLAGITQDMPKPLVPIGDRPILWHIMKGYAEQGFNKFTLCLGYKGNIIRDYFIDNARNQSDLTVNLKSGEIKYHGQVGEDWEVTLIDTGEDTLTAQRLHKVGKYIDGRFMLTYGDGLGDININELLEFHKKTKAKNGIIGTFTGVHPYSKYGLVEVKRGIAKSFSEKPLFKDHIVNGGFMVFEREMLDCPMLKKNIPLEDMIKDLVKRNKIGVYVHEGFWQGMDTNLEYSLMNNLWKSGEAPWKKNWKK